MEPSLPHCREILCHLSHQGSPRILEWVAYLGELSNPGIESALQVDSLPAEPQGKPKDTGVGSLVVEVVEVDPGIKLAERNRVEQESSRTGIELAVDPGI